MAASAEQRFLTADEFLQIEFGLDLKAELENGVIRMMGGASIEHSLVQGNLFRWFGEKLGGGGCRPHASDAGLQTGPWSVRYPDLTIDCGPVLEPTAGLRATRLLDPRIVFEILSSSTRDIDEQVKLPEYQRTPSIRMIVFVNPGVQQVRIWVRGPVPGDWQEQDREEIADLDFEPAGLFLTLPHAEIFARD